MNGKRMQIGAVLFALIMAVSMVAAPGAALMDGGESEVQLDDSTATISDSLQDTNGETVTVVARGPKVSSELIQAQGADALKAHAEETQADIKNFARTTDGVTLKASFWITSAVLLEVNTEKVDINELAEVDGVQELHENFEVQVPEQPSTSESSDAPDTANQAGYETTYGLAQINAPKVWDQFGTQGEGAEIAVLDTGVAASHPALEVAGFAEFDQNGDVVGTEPRDSGRHGTHVSGTVSGDDSSGKYVGVAPNVELYHGLVLDGGRGSFGAILGGMQWAVEQDVDAISMSLGSSGYTSQFIDPVRNAHDAGVIVIAASSNSGEGTSGSPGNVYDALAIGATDSNRDVTDFSSGEVIDTQSAWGADAPADWPNQYIVPDVVAPGGAVESTVPGGDYSELSGTSMATPHVSGVVALMESATERDLTPEEIREALIETTNKPADAPDEKDNRYGEGIVDALAAVEYVTKDDPSPPPSDGVTLDITDAAGQSGDTVTVDVTASGDSFGGYEALIEFDPSVVQFQGASSGDLSDVTVNFDNEQGLVKIAQAEQSAVSDVTIAQLEFEIVGDSGSTDLSFVNSGTLVSDTSGNSLDLTYETGTIQVEEEEPSCSLPGDVVPDGQLTAADAAVHQQALAGNEVPDDFNADCADVNGDGEINTGDVVALLNKIVEFDSE